jgi:hypothetical protein
MLAIGPKVHRFKPGRRWWLFKGNKNLHHTFLQRESETVGPMLQDFTARSKYERNTS